MNTFTLIYSNVQESYKKIPEKNQLQNIIDFSQKFGKELTPNLKNILKITITYKLIDKKDLDNIKNSSKTDLKKVSNEKNIPINELITLWGLLKDLKTNQIKALPQYMTSEEYDAINKGSLKISDLTIDLDSPAGRNAVTKMYMPLVYKIVNQYVNTSSLSKQDLISAALDGFTDAMNQWKKPSSEQKTVPFKTYVSYRIKQQILNDINTHSHGLSGGNWYNTKKYAGQLDTKSLDTLLGWNDEDNEWSQDKLKQLGVEDPDNENTMLKPKEEQMWQDIYKELEREFNSRQLDVFYRFFGLNGYKREKSKDIAKSIGYSESAIRNSFINKILKYLKTNPKTSNILNDLKDIYNESLMCDIINLDESERIQTMLEDNTYLLLEDLCKWDNVMILMSSLSRSFMAMKSEASEPIKLAFKGKINIDEDFISSNKDNILLFLSIMCPSESVYNYKDSQLLELMKDISDYIKKYKIENQI